MSANTTTAADLAAVLGTVKAQVDSYNTERKQLADSLRQIVSSALQLLNELGEGDAAPAARGRRGRPPGSQNRAAKASGGAKRRPGRPKGSGKAKGKRKGGGMSPEGRARVAAAQKARWAAKKAQEAK